MKALYHYTSYYNLLGIISSGRITTTASNLLYPENMRIENGNLVSDTDNYKPVVWLTDSLSPEKQGLHIPNASEDVDKRRIRITIDAKAIKFEKWAQWADRNNMERNWREQLTKGQNYKSWYVAEEEIPMDACIQIYDRYKNAEYVGYKGE